MNRRHHWRSRMTPPAACITAHLFITRVAAGLVAATRISAADCRPRSRGLPRCNEEWLCGAPVRRTRDLRLRKQSLSETMRRRHWISSDAVTINDAGAPSRRAVATRCGEQEWSFFGSRDCRIRLPAATLLAKSRPAAEMPSQLRQFEKVMFACQLASWNNRRREYHEMITEKPPAVGITAARDAEAVSHQPSSRASQPAASRKRSSDGGWRGVSARGLAASSASLETVTVIDVEQNDNVSRQRSEVQVGGVHQV